MTTKRHPHADLIHAYAEGAQIQMSDGSWPIWKDMINPSFCEELEYRIKPAPKPDVVRYANIYGPDHEMNSRAFNLRETIDECKKVGMGYPIGIIKITISGETGKLTVEVVE